LSCLDEARLSTWGAVPAPEAEGAARLSCANAPVPTAAAIINTEFRVPFTACDRDGLPVAHVLPSPTDARVFLASLTRLHDNATFPIGTTGVSVTPQTYGQYVVVIAASMLPFLGRYAISLALANAQFGEGDFELSVSCPAGQGPTPDGLSCSCPIGLVIDPRTETCVPCPQGTSSSTGGSTCDVCAPGTWRSSTAVKVSEATCRTCRALEGLSCPMNSTTATLVVKHGWWRLSARATTAYRCEESKDGSSTACDGGAFGDSTCLPNHAGPLCKVCLLDNQYFDGEAAVCKNCPTTGGSSVAGIVAIFVSVLLLAGVLFFLHEQRSPKFDKCSVPLRRLVHHAKVAGRSIGLIAKFKIFLCFAQVVATLERTYSIGLPEAWTRWTAFWRVLGEIEWASWVVPSDCIIGTGAVQQLCLRALAPLVVVIALPFCGATVSVVQTYLVSRVSAKETRMRGSFGSEHAATVRSLHSSVTKGMLEWLPASLVLAFCFTPSVSSSIFRAWYCISYSHDDLDEHSFLAQDPAVRCDGSDEHNRILTVAWIFVCVWPIGMVAVYAALLIPCHRMLRHDEPSDFPLLRATAFLHRDYKAAFYWWEVASLMQRTILTGWLVLVDAEQHLFRLLIALLISILFLVAVLVCNPHKKKLDSAMAAGCQVLFICIFIGGIMIRLYEDIAKDGAGSPELAYRVLGVRSTDDAVSIMIIVTFGMISLVNMTLAGEMYTLSVQNRLEKKWSVSTMDPPRFKWKPRGIYACFLSHYKMEAASDARYVNDMLRRMLLAPVFLDSSVLRDLRDLITEGVHKSDTLLLLGTKDVLTRPWCLLELLETKRMSIPVIIVVIHNSGFSLADAQSFIDHFEDQMAEANPEGLSFLRNRLGDNFDELREAVTFALDANWQAEPLVFDPHAGDGKMVATMKDVVERMADATGRTVKWHGGQERVPQQRATTTSSTASQFRAALRLAAWMVSRPPKSKPRNDSLLRKSHTERVWKGLPGQRVVSNVESTIFVCCARSDAVHHARVLRSALSMKIGSGCAIGGGEDSFTFVSESELFVVILTKELLSSPASLFEIWMASMRNLPIVTVSITGGGYDFANATAAFDDLPATLDALWVGNSQKLQDQLPDGTTVADVGRLLRTSLTTVIALSWATASKNQLDAVVDDIITSIPRKHTRALWSSLRANGRHSTRRHSTRPTLSRSRSSTGSTSDLKGSATHHHSAA